MSSARRKYERIPLADAFPPKVCGRCGSPMARKMIARGGRPETPSEYRNRKSCKSEECSLRFHDGRRQHPLFGIWYGILRRCYRPRHHAYANYGGRGIYVALEWQDFWKFVQDMHPRPKGASIDRIDNDGPYAKWNCRWSNHKQQTRNSRLNKYNLLPPEAPALSEYAPRLGITRQAAWYRIRRFGWKPVWNGAGATARHPLPPDFKEQP